MGIPSIPVADRNVYSCLQDVPVIPVYRNGTPAASCDRNTNFGRNAIAALPLHSPARSGHLRLTGGAAGAMSMRLSTPVRDSRCDGAN